jgi:acyl-CoA reductase-like NAD-dependent aldehyde dehydrogenase
MEYLNGHGGKLVCGGNIKGKRVEPTVIVDPRPDSTVMQDEIFGPILCVIEFTNFDEAINHINKGDKPLAAYYFGAVSGTNKERFLRETSSGAAAINEAIFQKINQDLPFGGVGLSGQGRL